jgi:hypothetical protein
MPLSLGMARSQSQSSTMYQLPILTVSTRSPGGLILVLIRV